MQNPLEPSVTSGSNPTPPVWAPLKALASVATFGSQFLSQPNTIGSVVPSLPSLGRRMAQQVPRDHGGYVVELGAGTGAITAELLKSGISPAKLIAIDCSPAMARVLRKRYPQLNVIVGSAACLHDLLHEHLDLQQCGVGHIVSGLPLRSLPKPVVEAIAEEVHRVLPRGGRFIQFTYDLRPKAHPALGRFRLESSSLVLCNIPPARVNVYNKH